MFNDDFSDNDWSADAAEEDFDQEGGGVAVPDPPKEKRTPRRQAASKSQQFMKEMAESLAKENYEDGDEEYEVFEEQVAKKTPAAAPVVAPALDEEEAEPDYQE